MTRVTIDWPEIMRLYSEGVHGPRELERMFGVSESTIRSRAKKDGVKQPAKRSARVANRIQDALDRSVAGETALTAKQVEDALVRVGHDVVLEHRSTIRTARSAVDALLNDLTTVSRHRQSLHATVRRLLDAARAGGAAIDEDAIVVLEALEIAYDLGMRSKAVQALSSALKHLIGLERQAFNIPAKVGPDGTPAGGGALKDLLDEIDGAGTGL